jgi:FdhE protein
MHSGKADAAARAKASPWDKRVQRAAELAERFSHSAEILDFYRWILEFQSAIYNELLAQLVSAPGHGVPFRERLDKTNAAGYFPSLLSLVQKRGTAKLAQDADELAILTPEQQHELLHGFLQASELAPHSFFARVLLQPHAEWLASGYPPQPPGSAGSVCPICGSRPQAAVLRPEGDGGKRFLLCSLCLTEWEFRRVLCPTCGEENYQQLPRYQAEEIAAVRVEACDTCHFYLKSVDLTVDGLAVPLVDEAATVTLDLWAIEHGYKKVEPNPMGF